MAAERGLSVLAHPDQWAHCQQTGCAPLPGGGVQLSWTDPDARLTSRRRDGTDACPQGATQATTAAGEPAGLAYDPWCVAYRSRPATGAVEALTPGAAPPPRCPGAYDRPRGLAVDAARRLYVADSGARAVIVIDLQRQRVLRAVSVAPARPLDVLAWCGRALALIAATRSAPPRLIWLEGRRGPRKGPTLVRPRCPADARPVRLAAGPLVLWTGTGGAVVARPDGRIELELDQATDIDVGEDQVLVLAGRPNQGFRRFAPGERGWVELEPLGAPGYDGGAVTHTPAGRIAYTTQAGIGTTTGSRAHYGRKGTVTSYRLDSGAYGTRWGRMFLDACLPPHTAVRARFLTSDDDTVPDPIEPDPGTPGEAYPPLPSAAALAQALDETRAAGTASGAIFRRPTGREDAWPSGAGPDGQDPGSIQARDGYQTYEAAVLATPGRYLWLWLELTGTEQACPRVRAVRLERPGHPLLNSLPRSWSRTEDDADFLQRYLAPAEGMLHELDWRSAQRAVLLDPIATPSDKLDWLAGFAGLVLDRRWPEPARRRLVAEAYPLFTRRGTKAALLRLISLYLDREPRLIEQWQLRGLGGTVLGTEPGGPEAPHVGGSARASGTLGRFTIGGSRPGSDAYKESAHRCTVVVPGLLTAEQRAVLTGLLEVHRPAHVKIELCEAGTGMRVGERLRVDVTSFVGPGAGWQDAVLGRTGLGSDALLGRAAEGTPVGQGLVGEVRVG